jgi:hypothetical protein
MLDSPTKRIVDSGFYEQVRQEQGGVCLWGLAHQGRIGGPCQGASDVHHIVYRGRGGDDVPENGIILCRAHHRYVHQNNVNPDELRKLVDKYVSDVRMMRKKK